MLLNCDLGESYGSWTMGQDTKAMANIDQANILKQLRFREVQRSVAKKIRFPIFSAENPEKYTISCTFVKKVVSKKLKSLFYLLASLQLFLLILNLLH